MLFRSDDDDDDEEEDVESSEVVVLESEVELLLLLLVLLSSSSSKVSLTISSFVDEVLLCGSFWISGGFNSMGCRSFLTSTSSSSASSSSSSSLSSSGGCVNSTGDIGEVSAVLCCCFCGSV